MRNGNLWTKSEIDVLVRTATEGGCPVGLAASLGRTEEALRGKAGRLRIRFSSDSRA